MFEAVIRADDRIRGVHRPTPSRQKLGGIGSFPACGEERGSVSQTTMWSQVGIDQILAVEQLTPLGACAWELNPGALSVAPGGA